MYDPFTPLLISFGAVVGLVILLEALTAYIASKQPEKPEYQVLKYWRDDLAKHYYQLQRLSRTRTYYICTGEEGNFKWAQRQQKHYKCKIVNEE